MKFFKITTIALFFMISAATLFAVELQVAEILSEPEGNLIHQFIFDLDANGDIVQIIDRTPDGDVTFSIAEVISGDELVLACVPGTTTPAVKLVCHDIPSGAVGGDMTMSYKNDVFTWKDLELYSYRIPNTDDWGLYTESDDELIENMTIVGKYFWGMLIGIDRIDINDY